jgi:PTH1 family peptidyl-tRNA hydrolase
MLTIVGLGNSEEKYQETRHNFGFFVLDQLAAKFLPENWQVNRRFSCLSLKGDNFWLVKPQTAMNNSGLVLAKIVNFYKLDINNLLLVHDDLDLDLGNLKLNKSQSAAGHHGVESVIANLGTADFWRLRLGIGHPQILDEDEIVNFVLEKFSPQEKTIVSRVANQAVGLLEKGLALSGWEALRGSYKV